LRREKDPPVSLREPSPLFHKGDTAESHPIMSLTLMAVPPTPSRCAPKRLGAPARQGGRVCKDHTALIKS
jgi:hypothetical protein